MMGARASLRSRLVRSTALAAALLPMAAAAQLPTAESVLAVLPGDAAATRSFTATNVEVGLVQRRVIIDWADFSVPEGTRANFFDGRAMGVAGTNNMAVLNRIVGPEGGPIAPTDISGQLTSDANVAVFIYNPTGVLFGATAAVNVGGLLATTIAPNEANFLDAANTSFRFNDTGATGAVTVTAGATLTAASTLAQGGIVLIGATVDSAGTLSATGDVGLVAATDVTVSYDPANPLSMTIAQGTTLAAPVVARGTIGGRNVVFAAATRNDVLDAVLDIGAVVTATTALATDRGITLVAGPAGETTPAVTITAGEATAGIIGTDLGGSLTATGLGGGIVLLGSGGFAAPGTATVLDAAGAVRVRAAAGGIALGDIDGAAVSLLADTGDLGLGDVTAGGALTLTASLDDVTLGTAQSAGLLTIAGQDIAAAAAISTGGALDIDGTTIAGLAGGRAALTAAAGIDVDVTGTARLGIVGAGTTASVDAASIDATSISTDTGAVAATATTGDLVLGSADAGGALTLTASAGDLSLGTVEAAGLLRLLAQDIAVDSAISSGGAIDIDGTTIAGRAGGRAALTADAALDVDVTGTARLGIVGAGTTVSVDAASIDATSVAADTGAIAATATTGDLVLGSADAGGALTLTASAGDLSLGTVEAVGLLRLLAQDIAVDSAVSTGGAIDIDGTTVAGRAGGRATLTADAALDVDVTGTARLGVIGAGDATTVDASSIDATSLGSTTGSVIATAATGDLTLGGGNAGDDLVLRALSGTIGATERILVTDLVDARAATIDFAEVDAGRLDARTSTGALAIGAAGTTSSIGSDTLLDVDTALTVRGTLAVAGDATLTAGTTFTGGSVTSTGDLSVDIGGAIDAARLGGGTSLRVRGASVTLVQAASTSGGARVDSTTGGILLGGATVGGNLDVVAATTATVSGAAAVTGDYNVTGDVVALGTASAAEQAATGAVTIVARDGAISGLAGLTLRSNSDGTGGERLTLDATGGGIDFDAGSLLAGGSTRQSEVGVRLRTTGTALGLGRVSARVLGTVDTLGVLGPLTNDTTIRLRGAVSLVESLSVATSAGDIFTAGVSITGAGNTLAIAPAGDLTSTGTSAPGGVAIDAPGDVRIVGASSSAGDVVVTATGLAQVTGDVSAGGDYRVSGATVTLGGAGATQAADGTVEIVQGTGDLTAQPGVTLSSDADDDGAGDFILRSNGGLDFTGTTLRGGAGGRTAVRVAAGPGAALRLGTVEARLLASWEPTLTATSLDHTGAVRIEAVTTRDSVAIGSPLGRPTSLTLGAATSITGDVVLDVAGTITGLGAAGADLAAATAGRDVRASAGGAITLNDLVAGRDAIIVAGGEAAVTGDVTATRDYLVTGTGVTLGGDGAALQSAGAAVEAVATTGTATGGAGLVLTSDSDTVGGGDLIVRAAGVIDFGPATLRGGPARSAAVRVAAGPGAALTLGTVTARRLASWDPTLTAVALDAPVAVTLGTVTVETDLIIGSVPAGRPASLTLGSATSVAGAVRIDVAGTLGGAAGGRSNLDALTSVTVRAATARLGTVAAGGAIDLAGTGLLEVAATDGSSILTLNAGALRTGALVAAGDIDATATTIAGLGGAPARAGFTSSSGAVRLIATDEATLGAVRAAGDLTVVARTIDATEAMAGLALTVTARELAPSNAVSLLLATASAGGAATVTVGRGSGGAPVASNGSAQIGTLQSGGDLQVTAADGAVTGIGGAGATFTSDASLTVTAGSVLRVASAEAAGDLGLVAGAASGAARDGRIEAVRAVSSGGSLSLLAFNDAVAGAAGIELGEGDAAGAASLRTTGTRGDIAVTSLAAGGAAGLTSAGLIDATSIDATTTLTTLSAGASVLTTVTAGGLIDARAVTTLAFTTLTSSGGAIALDAGGALGGGSLTAGTDIQASGASVDIATIAAAALRIDSTGATILGTATTDGALEVAAGSTLDFTTLASAAGDVTLTAGEALYGDLLEAAGLADVRGATLDITTIDTGTLRATSFTASQFGTVTATGDIVATAGSSLGFGSVGGTDVSLVAGTALNGTTLTASGLADLGGATIDVATIAIGSARLTSSAGTRLGTLTATGDIGVTAGTTLDFVALSGATVTLTADAALAGGELIATGAADLDAGSIDVATLTANMLRSRSAGATSLGASDVTGDADAAAGTTFDFDTLTGSGVTLTAGGTLTGTTLTASALADLGGATIDIATITAGSARLASDASTQLGTLTATGAVEATAGTTLDFGTLSGAAVTLAAGGALTGNTLTVTGTADLTGDPIAIGSIAAGTLRSTSPGAIDLGTTVVAVDIDATAGTTLDFVALSGAAVTLAAGTALTGGDLTATGAADLDGGSIDIATLAAATLRSRSTGATRLGASDVAGDVDVAAGTTLDFDILTGAGVTLAAGGALTGGVLTASGLADVTGGSVDLATVNTGMLRIASATTTRIGSAAAAGAVAVTAGTTLNFDTLTGGGVMLSAGETLTGVALTASGRADLDAATIDLETVTAGSLVAASTGATRLGNAEVAGAAAVAAGTTLDFDTLTGGDVTLSAGGTLTGDAVTAGGFADLGVGSVTIATLTAATLRSDSFLATQFGTVDVTGDVAVTARSTLAFDVLSGSDVTLSAGETLTGGTLGAAGLADLAGGAIDLERVTANSLTASSVGATRLGTTLVARTVDVAAGTTLSFATLDGGDVTLSAGGALTGGSLAAGGFADLDGGSVTVTTLTAATLRGVSNAATDIGTADVAGDVLVTAGTTLDFDMLTGRDVTLSAAETLTGGSLGADGLADLDGGAIDIATLTAARLRSSSEAGTRLGTATLSGDVDGAAGTSFDFGMLSGSGVGLVAGGVLTGIVLTAAGAADLRGGSVDVATIAAGTLGIESGTATRLGTAMTTGGIVVTAGSTIDFTTLVSTGAGVALDAGGAVAGSGLTARGDVVIAGGSVDVATIDAGTLHVDSIAATLLGIAAAEGAIDIDAGTTLDFGSVASRTAGVSIAAGDGVRGTTLAAATGIAATAGGGIALDTVTAGGSLDLDSGAAMTLVAADAGGAVRLASAATIGFTRVTGGATVTLDAVGTIDGDLLEAAAAVRVDGDGIGLDSVRAGTALAATSTRSLTLGSATAGGDAGLVATDALDFGTLTSGGATTLTAGGALTGRTLTAGGDVTARGGTVVVGMLAAGGAATLAAGSGVRIDDLSAMGDLRLTAGTTLDFTRAISRSGGATFVAGGTITGGTLDAAAAIDAAAVGIALDTLAAGTSLTLRSTVGMTLGIATAGDDIALTASGALGFTTLTSARGGATIDAGGAITGGRFETAQDITATGGDIAIETATAGGALDVTSRGVITLGTAEATALLTLRAATDLAFARATSGNGSASLTAGGAIGGGLLEAAEAIDVMGSGIALDTLRAGAALLAGSTGAISVTSAATGGDARLTAGSTLDFGTLTSGGAVTLTAGGAATGGTLDAGGATRVEAAAVDLATTRTGGNLIVVSTGGVQLGTAASGGDMALSAGTALAATTLDSGGGLDLAADSIDIAAATAGSALVSDSAAGTRFGTITSTGDARVTTGGGLSFDRLASLDGAIDVDAAAALDGGALAAARSARVTAANIALDDAIAGTTLDLTAAGLVQLATGTAGGDARLSGAAIESGLVTSGDGIDLTATADARAATTDAAGVLNVTAGGLAALVTVRAGAGLTVAARQVDLGTANAAEARIEAGNGGAAIGTLRTAGDIDVVSAGAIGIGTATSGAGALTALAATNLEATTLGAAGVIDAAAATGDLQLGTATAGTALRVTAAGSARLDSTMRAGADFVVDAADVTLAADGTARQSAGGRLLVTATRGVIRGGAGLTLTAGATGAEPALVLRATAPGGAIDLAAASRIGDGGLADARLEATGLIRLGEATATRAIELRAGDAELQSAVRADRVALIDTRTSGAMRLGDAPAGNAGEFGSVATGRFDLAAAEVNRVTAATLLLDARAQDVVIGDLAVGSGAGGTALTVRTTGRLDLLGRLALALGASGRTATLGGDDGAGLAEVIRVAPTPDGGGRIAAAGVALELRGDRIAIGYDTNLQAALGLAGTAPALTTSEVGSRLVSQPGSALYSATTLGARPYGAPVLLQAASLTVRFGSYALIQNTGQPGQNSGVVLGSPGGSGTLRVVAAGGEPNAFALFGTVNGFDNSSVALLGPDQLALSGPVSRANARANGCVIGSSGGCIATSLAQPGLIVFETRAEIFRAGDSLTLPFEPLIGTSNEALFSDIAAIDVGAEDVGADGAACTPGEPGCDDGSEP